MTKLQQLIKKTKWYYLNSDITQKNFPIPKKIETKNPQLIFLDKIMTSQECLDLIKSKGMRPANIYELLEWKNRTKDIQKGKYYIALGSSWEDTYGRHRVPSVAVYSDGVFKFSLGCFEGDWRDDDCLLCFCDKSLKTQTLTNSLTLKNFISDLKKLIEKYE